MKRNIIALLMVLAPVFAFSQIKEVPKINVKTLDGKQFNTSALNNDGAPMIISFWATWCKPCIKELTAINEEYLDLQDETGVKLYAVSTDDSRNSSRVMPFVNARAWEFDVLLDENGDFKRAMNVNNIPHTFLVDGSGKVVWQHNSYAPGDEEKLFALVRKLSKGESIQ
jgi:cytochrome c biogenesis protein CcmG/thiol:disulfide interchange protein DsbE